MIENGYNDYILKVATVVLVWWILRACTCAPSILLGAVTAYFIECVTGKSVRIWRKTNNNRWQVLSNSIFTTIQAEFAVFVLYKTEANRRVEREGIRGFSSSKPFKWCPRKGFNCLVAAPYLLPFHVHTFELANGQHLCCFLHHSFEHLFLVWAMPFVAHTSTTVWIASSRVSVGMRSHSRGSFTIDSHKRKQYLHYVGHAFSVRFVSFQMILKSTAVALFFLPNGWCCENEGTFKLNAEILFRNCGIIANFVHFLSSSIADKNQFEWFCTKKVPGLHQQVCPFSLFSRGKTNGTLICKHRPPQRTMHE